MSGMVLALALLSSLFAPVPSHPAGSSDQSASLASQVDRIFEKLDRPDSPGCALAVIEDGEIVYKKGYGMANLEYGVPITPSTVFNAGSITKNFTATAIVLLAQQGRLSLDDDIRTYVPELPEWAASVTIRHLLHHTAGLRNNLGLLAGWRFEDLYTPKDMLQLLSRQRELNDPPGDKYMYCNTCYDLLAVIVERASGQTVREFSRRHIFEPLGMKNSFQLDDHAELIEHRAYGYYPAGDGEFRTVFPSYEAAGAGGMQTTVEDLALWDRNFYEPRVGGKALVEQLLERAVLNNGDTADYGWAFGLRSQKTSASPTSLLPAGLYRGLPIMELAGGGGGYHAYLMRFPEQRFAVACLCNGGHFYADPFQLVPKVVDIYLADELEELEPSPTDEEPVQLSDRQLLSRAGSYWSEDADATALKISMKEGTLQILTVIGSSKMEPLSEDRFRVVGRPIEIRFEEFGPGGARRVVLTWSGEQPSVCERVSPYMPTGAELAGYAGSYVSEEIAAIYQVTLEGDRLMLKRLKFEPAVLHPFLRDVFIGPGWTIRFTREPDGQVTGFLLNGYGVRDLRFAR